MTTNVGAGGSSTRMLSEVVTNDHVKRTAGKPPKKRAPKERGFSGLALALLIPAGAIMALFTLYPLVRMFIFAFQDYTQKNRFNPSAPVEWAGLGNFKAILTGSQGAQFWPALGRSMLLAAVCTVLTMVFGMLIALLVNKLAKVPKTFVTVGMLLAWAMPALTSTMIFRWLFDSQYGAVNWILVKLGLSQFKDYSWTYEFVPLYFVLTIVIVWGAVPFAMFSLYAGLTQIPGEIMEAAELDGTNAWQRFWHVTVPSLKSVIAIVLMLQVIWDMRVFTQVYALQTGNYDQTNTIGVLIYRWGVSSGNYGTGSAMAVVLTIVMLIISFFYLRQLLISEDL